MFDTHNVAIDWGSPIADVAMVILVVAVVFGALLLIRLTRSR
jgi:hypothetical protein